MEKEKYVNETICAKCGGKCCHKSGCDYFVSDFEPLNKKAILKSLEEGRTSIVAFLIFEKQPTGKLICEKVLSLRARNTNRDVIDLLSYKTKCASLEEHGCHYDITTRPSGGVALIPRENGECYSEIDRLEELKKWLPYQKMLEQIVRRYTRKSVDEKLKEDVENLLYVYLTENYKDSQEIEIDDVKLMIPSLVECFPEESQNAQSRYIKANPLKRLSKY